MLKYGPADVAEMEIEWRSAAFVDESLRELPGVFYTSFEESCAQRTEPNLTFLSVGSPCVAYAVYKSPAPWLCVYR